MFSHNPTLEEFTCPITICQPTADLEDILRIFASTNSTSLAIKTTARTWGIVDSQGMMTLLAKSWRKLAVESADYSVTSYGELAPDREQQLEVWQEAIAPAVVCQGKTRLRDFLASWDERALVTEKNHYLIANNKNEIIGQLDKDKLLTYLAQKVKQSNEDTALLSSWFSILDYFDSLAFPASIESSADRQCYQNRYWQELIAVRNRKLTKELEPPPVDLCLEKAFGSEQYAKENLELARAESRSNFCYLEDRYKASDNLLINSSESNATYYQRCNLKLEQAELIPSTRSDISSPEQYWSPQESDSLAPKLELGKDWHYLQIPLSLNQKLRETEPDSSYWLILGIKAESLAAQSIAELNSTFIKKLTINRLLTTLGHELKSPLTGILGLSKLLSSEKLGILNQRQSFYVQLIHNSGQKLMGIVNDLIELTNLTTKGIDAQLEAIDLESLLRQLYQETQAKLNSHKPTESTTELKLVTAAELKLKIESEAKLVIGDRPRLGSIISHLILETMLFSDVATSTIEIEVRVETKGIALEIGNKLSTNASLSPQTQNTETTSRGVGLNLIIAKYIAEMLQGELKSVYSTSRCSFTLLLPNVIPQSNPSNTVSPRLPPTKNLTILCLYPELEVLDLNRSQSDRSSVNFNLKNWAKQDWLTEKGDRVQYRHRVIEADGLEQAHILARIWQLDVIVLDGETLADPDSYLRSLQESEYLSALPLVALDAKTSEAANQIEGLNVYPCLLPAECRSIEDLMQVIQIAAGI